MNTIKKKNEKRRLKINSLTNTFKSPFFNDCIVSRTAHIVQTAGLINLMRACWALVCMCAGARVSSVDEFWCICVCVVLILYYEQNISKSLLIH